MAVKCVDKSGEPRSDEELREALQQVEMVMVKRILEVPPNLGVYLAVIREALMELIKRRSMDREIEMLREYVGYVSSSRDGEGFEPLDFDCWKEGR